MDEPDRKEQPVPRIEQLEVALAEKSQRLAAAEALLSRAWIARESFWFQEEVCIFHPFFQSGWVARKNPVVVGKKGATGAEALSQCDTYQFNGWGFGNPIDAYLAAVQSGWLPAEPQQQGGG